MANKFAGFKAVCELLAKFATELFFYKCLQACYADSLFIFSTD